MNHRQLSITALDRAFPKWKGEDKGAAARQLSQALDETLIRMWSAVIEFHEKYGLEYNGPPRLLPEAMEKFRIDFLEEELNEYKTSTEWGNKAGQLDALVDLIYVALGTAYLHGYNFPEAFRRVHVANMQKIRVQRPGDSKRDSVFDVVKPTGWMAPDHSDLVEGPEDEPKREDNPTFIGSLTDQAELFGL